MPIRLRAGGRKRKPASRTANIAGRKAPLAPEPLQGAGQRAAIFPISGANFELLFSSNPYPMYVFDARTFAFLEVNDAAVKTYGYTRDELLRMRITDIRPQEDVPRLVKVSSEAKQRPKQVAREGCWRHRRKNGEVFEVEVTTQRILFRGKDAVLAVIQDMTAHAVAERQISERTAFLRALTENNPSAIVAIDLGRRVQMCNPAFEHLFGYELGDIRGRTLESLVAVPGHEAETVMLVQDIARDGSICLAAKRRRRDGSIIDVRITGVPLVVNGEPQGFFGIYEDITERSRAASAQQIAEERYKRIFENAIEGFFESTPQGKFLTVNPAMARIAGYSSPAEMIAEIYDIGQQLYVDPSIRDEVKRQLEEKGELNGFECQMPRKDGSIIWISMNVRALRDTSGKIVSHDGTAEDVTERKVAELRRQVSTEIIHAIGATDNLDDLLGMVYDAISKALDADNCFVALRDAAGTFTFPLFRDKFDPQPEPQELGRGCASYVLRTGEAQLISPHRMQELVAQGEVDLQGTPSRSWLGVPLRTPTETIGVLVVQSYDRENAYTGHDVEFLSSVGGQIAFAIERKRAEALLRESEARLRVLMEQLPAVVWTVDTDLRFTSALGAGLARLGLKRDQIVGMLLSEYFETKDPSFLPIAAHRRAVGGEPVTFQLDWKEGSYACHVEPLRDAEGGARGAICMALDVTDRKRLEEQFRQAQKMEAVGRLAGGIAHDFNNLLMVIQGYADLMTDRLPAADSLRRNAEQIQVAARRATSLTQQLLAFSRKQMLAPKVLNVYSVVSDMERILRRLIGEDIELRTSTEPDLWLVKADRSQIEQVIMNLAVNARDAMPRGGLLTIETGNVELDQSDSQPPVVLSPGKYVMLAVTDNGCGMDANIQAHIFEPFYTTKEKGKGTGLGLATVYGIVKQSGGYIWVYSEPGRGTTFKIYLPKIAEEVPREVFDRRPESSSLPRGSEVILLVEDEKGVRELARQYLEMSGYTVLEAEDGHTALELSGMHSGPIHLLMTDVVMPGISGRELAERISRLRPGIKILYMSGYTDQSIVHHGILADDAVLLQKPFNMASLASKLREILSAETVQR